MSKSSKIQDEFHFRRYYPHRNENKINNIFDFYISNDESVIYKNNNNSSPTFCKLLQSPSNFDHLQRVLDGSIFCQEVREHVCNGFDLELDGSHKMKFLHGFRLDSLNTYSIKSSLCQLFVNECKVLIEQLSKANVDGNFFGDWAMHNLVFSFELKRIMNIDLEGFLTYYPLPKWANFAQVEKWLTEVIEELQTLLSMVE
jgi:hypothetical protein